MAFERRESWVSVRSPGLPGPVPAADPASVDAVLADLGRRVGRLAPLLVAAA
jgi:hypothetical protein